MTTVFVYRDGRTERVQSIDRTWLNPGSGVRLLVDLAAPSNPESLILSDTFAFHPLAVEDAMSQLQFPTVDRIEERVFAGSAPGVVRDILILEAHLSNVSNRLNEVMKVLTVVSTIFMPLTLLSGLWGMNVGLPRFPGGDAAQFWWLFGIMAAVVVVMLAAFRRRRWI